MKTKIEIGDTVKINMKEIKKYSSVNSYLNLIKKIIEKGNGEVYVENIIDDMAFIKTNKNDFLNKTEVPLIALYKDNLKEYLSKIIDKKILERKNLKK